MASAKEQGEPVCAFCRIRPANVLPRCTHCNGLIASDLDHLPDVIAKVRMRYAAALNAAYSAGHAHASGRTDKAAAKKKQRDAAIRQAIAELDRLAAPEHTERDP